MLKKIITRTAIGFVALQSFSAFALEEPSERYIVFMRQQNNMLKEGVPSTFTDERFEEVAKHFPAYSPDNEINVGMGCIFSYLRHDREDLVRSLRKFMALSQKHRVPIWIKIDGEQWWDNRPDLWNWWDPSLPGYNADNANNVEWTHWGNQHAIKLSWRNWGRQVRVLPPPNLFSKAYREACHAEMEYLIPIIMEWVNALPEEDKGLFVGLNVGWETSIGVNGYYYPNGNQFVDRPESEDPFYPPASNDVLSRGRQQIGYASLSSAGIRRSGDIEERDLTKAAYLHQLDLSRKAHELGVPRDMIFTHGFGNERGEQLLDAPVNQYSNPGWSSYWHSPDLLKDPGILRNLHRDDVRQWGAVEFGLLRPVTNFQAWYDALKNAINAPGLKMMCLYNWEYYDVPDTRVFEAVNRVIAEGLNPRELPPVKPGNVVKSLYEVVD